MIGPRSPRHPHQRLNANCFAGSFTIGKSHTGTQATTTSLANFKPIPFPPLWIGFQFAPLLVTTNCLSTAEARE
jgi:hypothetical protein